MTKEELSYLLLMEECAEVQHRVSKILRFGTQETEPGHERNNAERLREEMCDLLSIIFFLQEEGYVADINEEDLEEAMNKKKEKVATFLAYSQSLGKVTKE